MLIQDLINKLSQYPKEAEVKVIGSIKVNIPYSNIEEEEWKPTMDDIGECDVMGIY